MYTDYLRIRRQTYWGALAVACALGLAVGIGLLLWQRAASGSTVSRLETQLTETKKVSSAGEKEIVDLQTRIAAAEASASALTTQNAKLNADLAKARRDLAAAKSSESNRTVEITSRSVSPASVPAGDHLTLTVKVKGRADKVQMKLVSVVGGTTVTYNLTRVTSGSTDTWRRTVDAPTKKGMWRYYAYAYVGSKKTEMPGVSAWTFEVK